MHSNCQVKEYRVLYRKQALPTYIPLYTRAKCRVSDVVSASSKDEQEEFHQEHEDGGTSKYKLWLRMYRPDSLLMSGSPLPDTYQPLIRHSSMDQFLDSPVLPQRHPISTETGSRRVLTSSENLMRIKLKEKEKQRLAQEREERAKLRKAKKAHQECTQGGARKCPQATDEVPRPLVAFSGSTANNFWCRFHTHRSSLLVWSVSEQLFVCVCVCVCACVSVWYKMQEQHIEHTVRRSGPE